MVDKPVFPIGSRNRQINLEFAVQTPSLGETSHNPIAYALYLT